MDMSKIKLFYSEKVNQFYKPIRIDEDVGTVYMEVTKNRHDKSIRKDEILHIEEKPDYRFIVMHDANTTAENHFIKTIKKRNNVNIMIKEINDFKKNLLSESQEALSILIKLTDVKDIVFTKDSVRIRNAALKSYHSLDEWKKNAVENNKKSYENQIIPNNIMCMALKKRLFIERRDEYCFKNKDSFERKLAPLQVKKLKQANFPCGFLIKDKSGHIVAGRQGENYRQGKDYYTLSVEEVIEFVKGYDASKNKKCKKLYKIPMSEKKERELSMCNRILNEHELHLKNEHNYFFWVLDKHNNVIAGGEDGFGFKWLLKYCRRLRSQPKKKN